MERRTIFRTDNIAIYIFCGNFGFEISKRFVRYIYVLLSGIPVILDYIVLNK